MSGEACRIDRAGGGEADTIKRILGAGRIAVVGLSADPGRPSYQISSYLKRAGYEIVPVNPSYPEVLGQKSYATVGEVPGKVDLVLVFRKPEFAAEAAREAVAVGAEGVWLQSGIRSAAAREIAAKGGLDYVEDRCMMVEHRVRG